MAAVTDVPAAVRTPVPRRRKGRRASRFTPGIFGSYGIIILYAVTLLVPLYWLVISAFKPTLDILEKPFLPSFAAGWANFTQVWSQLDMAHAMANSFYITAVALVLTLVIALPAAYGLSRSGGKLALWTERLFAVGFLIPGFAALIPTLLLAIKLDLFNTREFIILWLPASAQPLAVILLTQFMRTVPAELEESARIDGAGRFRILWSIYLPLTMAGIATVSILNFISFWNEYLFTFIITGTNPAVRTVQVALPTLQGNRGITDYALVTAATTIAVAPVFVVYAVLNRRMENALVQGALKG